MAQEVPKATDIRERRLTVSHSQAPRPTRQRPQRRSLWPGRAGTLLPNVDPRLMPAEVPNPSHRHGAPSGPWPFLDLHVSINPSEILEPKIALEECLHRRYSNDEHCWCRYPQSLYTNWTTVQQNASRITEALRDIHDWRVYPLVVSKEGIFRELPEKSGRCKEPGGFWDRLQTDETELNECRVHALFVENMTGPVMQMLGTKYNIEPFFFSSSFGWIPSRYQESLIPKKSDHITITLTFIRCTDPFGSATNPVINDDDTGSSGSKDDEPQRNIAIKTNEFLWLASSEKILFSDIISLHMIRHPTDGHTIISYHAHPKFRATTAKQLRDRFQLTGRSVYWSHIFAGSEDPTFTFLSLLWYALYAWDESLEALYSHICALESEVLEKNDLKFTQELHRIRAHLLHYASLLEDFRKTVEFVKNTPYPALENETYFSKADKKQSVKLMEKECGNLLHEIERLEMSRKMQDKRLTNVMHLGFSTVNIQDSRRMHDLTKAAVRDSAAMKQIAYLTMVFLPASFVATAFGMNIGELNGSTPTLGQYFAAALPLTALTVWIIIAFQIQIKDGGTSRRRVQNSNRNRRSGSVDSSPTDDQDPYGLRKAYTSANGEIVINQLDSENERDPSNKSKYDNDSDGDDKDSPSEHGNRYRFQQASIWKRLGWPISLTHAAIVKWKEDQKHKGRHKRKVPKVEGINEGSDHALPTHVVRNKRERTLTPAAQIVADTRSAHSAQNSGMSVGRSTQSSVPPPLPPKTPTPKNTWQSSEGDPVSRVQAVNPEVESNDAVQNDTKDNAPQNLDESGLESRLVTAEVTLASRSTTV